MTQLLAGASGYSFKEWKGPFYPETIKPEEMLAYYAARLATVEINNSFYAMPKPGVLAHWVEVTPASFRFCFKLPREVSHEGPLAAQVNVTRAFVERMAGLGKDTQAAGSSLERAAKK